jgi:hypothetical protein
VKPTGGQTFWLVFSASRQVDRPFPRTSRQDLEKRTDLLARREADRWTDLFHAQADKGSRQVDRPFPRTSRQDLDKRTDLLAGVFSTHKPTRSRQADRPSGSEGSRQVDRPFPRTSRQDLDKRSDKRTDLLAGVFSTHKPTRSRQAERQSDRPSGWSFQRTRI